MKHSSPQTENNIDTDTDTDIESRSTDLLIVDDANVITQNHKPKTISIPKPKPKPKYCKIIYFIDITRKNNHSLKESVRTLIIIKALCQSIV